MEKHDSVTEIELAVAALRSDAGDDLSKRSADGGESLRRPVEAHRSVHESSNLEAMDLAQAGALQIGYLSAEPSLGVY